jgi:hypothetical protein
VLYNTALLVPEIAMPCSPVASLERPNVGDAGFEAPPQDTTSEVGMLLVCAIYSCRKAVSMHCGVRYIKVEFSRKRIRVGFTNPYIFPKLSRIARAPRRAFVQNLSRKFALARTKSYFGSYF